MRKYCDYLISVKKTDKGFVWYIRRWHNGKTEILERSLECEDKDERYFISKEMAYQNAAENIQYYYI